MNKIKTFFYVLHKSFTSAEYYQDVLRAPFSFSLKFYYVFFLFYAFLFTTVLTLRFLLPFHSFFTVVLPQELAKIYPEELVISIESGMASSNMTEPYYIPLSSLETLKEEVDKRVLGANTENLQNLLVIDTDASLESFPQYQTVALLTRHYLSILQENGSIESIPLNDMEDIEIDKTSVNNAVQVIEPYLAYVIPGLVLIIFIGILFFGSIGRLLYNFLVSILLYPIFMLWLKDFQIGYWKTYQVGLHLQVIGISFSAVWMILGVSSQVQYLETLLLLLVGFFIAVSLMRTREQKQSTS